MAPGSGTSISSIWKASRGWPKRSSRITQAAIVSGSSPGSVEIWATSAASTGMERDPIGGSEPVAPFVPQQDGEDRRRDHERADAEDEEVGARLHVADEPGEVLAEEAGDQRPHHEERRDHAQPRGGAVQALGAGVEVDPGQRGQVVGLALQLAADLREVVAD